MVKSSLYVSRSPDIEIADALFEVRPILKVLIKGVERIDGLVKSLRPRNNAAPLLCVLWSLKQAHDSTNGETWVEGGDVTSFFESVEGFGADLRHRNR